MVARELRTVIMQHEHQWSILQAAPVHTQGFTPTSVQVPKAINNIHRENQSPFELERFDHHFPEEENDGN